jgi:hypothetical protein
MRVVTISSVMPNCVIRFLGFLWCLTIVGCTAGEELSPSDLFAADADLGSDHGGSDLSGEEDGGLDEGVDQVPPCVPTAEILEDGIDQDCDGRDVPLPDDPRIIYVSATGGDDSFPGTRGQPKKTVGAGMALGQASSGGGGFQGRFIFIAAGVYHETPQVTGGISLYGGFDPVSWTPSEANTTIVIADSGIEDSMRISGGPDESVLQRLTVMVGGGVHGDLFALTINTTGRVTLVDCEIDAGEALEVAGGILSLNATMLEIRGSTIKAGPAKFAGGVDGFADDVHIGGSTISVLGSQSSTDGRARVVDVMPRATFVHLTIADSDLHASGGPLAIGVANEGADGTSSLELLHNTIAVDSNSAAGAGALGIIASAGSMMAIGNKVRVEGNTLGNVVVANVVSGIIALGGERSVLANNTIDVSGTGGLRQHGILAPSAHLINNSVRITNGNQAVGIGSSDGTRLVNNLVIVGNTDTALDLFPASAGPSTGITLLHNSLFAPPGGCTFSVNLICNTAPANDCTFLGCSAAEGNILSNCGVTGDFHIPAGSACKSSGIPPSAIDPSSFLDIDGESRPQGSWDIGADEIPN